MITHATIHDLPFIYRLFEEAIAYQKENNYIGWKNYDKDFLRHDVENKLLYKIMQEETISGIFSTCYSDPLIWREKEKNDALYLHRIVANRSVHSVPVFSLILDWAKQFAQEKQLKYLRMDTWAANKKIIDYYTRYGFILVEEYTTPDTTDLPVQHRKLNVALLEMVL